MNRAAILQKLLWHIRWMLLVGIMVYDGFGLIRPINIEKILLVNGCLFATYLFCKQIEGYFECISQCNSRRSVNDKIEN